MFILTDRFEPYEFGSSNLTPSLLSPAMAYDTLRNSLTVISSNGVGDLTVYDQSGNVLKRRRYNSKPVNGMAIGDVDGDGYQDYIYVADNDLFAVNKELSLLSCFPIRMDTVKKFQPLLADIDNDGWEEIIIPTATGINVYGYLQMDSVNYFPVSKGLNSHAFIEDLNGDGKLDLLYLSSDGYLYAQNLNTPRSSWRHYGFNSNHNPCFFEILPQPPVEVSDIKTFYVYPSPAFGSYCNLRFQAPASEQQGFQYIIIQVKR